MYRSSLYRFLIAGALCTAGFSATALAESKDRNALDGLVSQIHSKYYIVPAADVKAITLDCQSDLVNTIIGNIKDEALRNQLGKTKFTVQWDGTNNFKINISDIPRLTDPEADQKVQLVITHAKDRILGAFTGAAFVFGGLSAGNLSETESIIQQGGYQMLVLRGTNGVKQNFYFNSDLVLEKSEVVSGAALIADIQYEFEERNGKAYLKRSIVSYPKTDLMLDMSFDYREFDGIDLPAVFEGSLQIGKSGIKDTIRVLKVEITRRTG